MVAVLTSGCSPETNLLSHLLILRNRSNEGRGEFALEAGVGVGRLKREYKFSQGASIT